MYKVKTFMAGDRTTLDNDINKFIANKEIINVSFTFSPAGYYYAMVAYKE